MVEIDIYRVVRNLGTGHLLKDTSLAPNRYLLDGSVVSGSSINWPASSRDTSASNGDYVGVDVQYRYAWKSGVFTAAFGAGVSGSTTVWARIEPQVY